MQLKVNKELFNKKAEEKGLTQGQIAEKVGKKKELGSDLPSIKKPEPNKIGYDDL